MNSGASATLGGLSHAAERLARWAVPVTKLEYELGRADMEAFFAHHVSHSPDIVARDRRMRWVWGGLFAVLGLVYVSWSPAGGFAFLTIAIVYLLFYVRFKRWWYVRHNRRLSTRPADPRLGTTKLELAGGQLLIEAPEGVFKLEMSAIRRIDESDSHYFVYLGPISAVVIPKAVDQARPFVETLRTRRAAA